MKRYYKCFKNGEVSCIIKPMQNGKLCLVNKEVIEIFIGSVRKLDKKTLQVKKGEETTTCSFQRATEAEFNAAIKEQ
jgi:hypothetical protein